LDLAAADSITGFPNITLPSICIKFTTTSGLGIELTQRWKAASPFLSMNGAQSPTV